MDVQRTGGSSVVRPPSPMESLEKQLSCPICLEMFTKPVVILPCQHNLCRGCASDLYDSRNPYRFSGGVFRCPTCRFEVVLDRHGVHGLQRNLLVENIIDLYKQQQEGLGNGDGSGGGGTGGGTDQSLKPKESKEPMCAEHEDERINIYCVTCQTPTCSMCKVFGQHKACDVAPLSTVYKRQKTEIGDGIAILVASNDRIQALISQMEAISQTIEENGRRQQEHLVSSFDSLVAILEERKRELVGLITKQQDDKLKYVRSLICNHGSHLETAIKLVETAIQSMEEPHMAVFLQSATVILEKITVTSKAAKMECLEPGYESMSHFTINTDDVADMLRNIDFCSGMGDEGEEDTEEGDDLSSLAGGELDYCHQY